MDMDLHTSSKKMDFGTPTKWFSRLHDIFSFTIDVCASAHNHKLDRYWTESDDALSQIWWGERCWCNPPYGRALPKRIDKILSETGSAELIAALLPLSAKTRWFQRIGGSDFTLCMVKGALVFEPAENGAPFSSVLILWGDLTDEQFNYLKSLGLVVTEQQRR